jgi:hypothetical protein
MAERRNIDLENIVRVYSQKGHRGTWTLVSWVQFRCKRCGRFLAKKKWRKCDACRRKDSRDYNREHSKEDSPIQKLRDFVRWNIEKIQVGDYI